MRGKVYFENKYRHVKRITPAYAGKRTIRLHIATFAKDHPRLCGEKQTFMGKTVECKGSPPPMRGKVYAAVSMPDTVGITPAYAGKSIFLFPPIR